ncbi:MAG: M14 metallopeptidase family protein [Maribacter sp.]
MDFPEIEYQSIKEKRIKGRYVNYDHISGILKSLPPNFKVDKIGESVKGLPINSVTFGNGSMRILMWSQMHGNESTTTKAVFDVLNWVGTESKLSNSILKNCTIKIIPILNPDGAKAYTRFNANDIDLNRDAQDRSQPESRILRTCFEDFKPDFCFNLHDQRTIFNVGGAPKPATVSFLAPAFDEERNSSESRAISMQLIVAMNQALQKIIPNQVGRYDDGFNANCVGDTFQMLGTPTILFEAGHCPDDYERESTRAHIFKALITALQVISTNSIGAFSDEDYVKIPENNKLFFDILIKNAHRINSFSYAKQDAIGILFKETLAEDAIKFLPKIERKGNLQGYYGHKTFDCLNEANLADLKMQPYWNIL